MDDPLRMLEIFCRIARLEQAEDPVLRMHRIEEANTLGNRIIDVINDSAREFGAHDPLFSKVVAIAILQAAAEYEDKREPEFRAYLAGTIAASTGLEPDEEEID